MQSVNGDVQLSVTLDTKGIQSDAQKIKKELEKGFSNDGQFKPTVDEKHLTDELSKISRSDNLKIKVTPVVDKNEIENVGELIGEATEFDNAKNQDAFKELYREWLTSIQKDLQDGTNIANALQEQLMAQFPEEWKNIQSEMGNIQVHVNHDSVNEASKEIDAVTEKVEEFKNESESVDLSSTSEQVTDDIDEQFDEYKVNLEDIKERWQEIFSSQYTEEGFVPKNKELQELKMDIAELSEPDQQAFADWADQLKQVKDQESGIHEKQQNIETEQDNIFIAVQKYKTAISDAKAELERLSYDYEIMSKGYHYSDDFVRLKTDAEYLTKELNKTNEKLHQMELSGEQDTEEYQKMAEKANNLSRVLNDIVADMSIMREDGSAFEAGIDVDQLETSKKLFDTMCNKVALMQQRMKELSGETDNLSKNTSKVSFSSKLVGVVNNLKNSMRDFGSFVKNTSTIVARSLGKNLTKIIGSFKTFIKQLTSSNKHFGVSLKQILGYAIGIRSLFEIFGRLRGMITEGTKNLIMWHNGSNRANEAISNLTSSLTFLKNAWGAAFEPILSYIAPLLDTFIQKLADVANAISYMLAKLTGQSTWYKAIRVQKDYAKSLSKTGKAAKDAEGKLADYDKLTMVKKDKSSGSGVDDMFEELPIETAIDSIDDFLNKLKDAWINADFTDVGRAIGLKLKEALDNIPWDYIKEYARKIAHSLATFLNGFFETEGLATSIGKTIAEAFNTVFNFIDEFVHTLHWDSIGKFIAESLFSFVYNFDAETAGSAVGGTIRGIIESLYTALDTFAEEGGFELIGEKIATFLLTGLEEMSNVRESGLTGWEELGESITIAVDGLITSITTAIQKMSEGNGWYDLGKGIAQLCSKIDFTKFIDDLNELAESIIKAIGEALKGVGDTSPLSTAIAAVIAGLIIAVDTVTLLIMSATAVIGFDVGKIIGDAITGGEDSMWYQEFSWSELFNENNFEDVVNGMILMLDELADAVLHPKNAFELLGAVILMPVSMAMLAYNTIRRLFSGELWDHIKMRLEETTYWWKITFSEMSEKLKKFVDETVYWWKNLFTNIFNTLTEKWKDIGGTLSTIKTNVVTGLTFFKSTVINIFSNLATAIKNPLNSMIGSVESFVNYLIQGINNAIKALNSVDFDVPDWVPEIGGQSFGLNIPSLSKITLPRLAQGAVIPPNKEFMAVLGDQKSGTNIETPLKTMMDAFRQVLNENGGSGNNNQPIVLQLNGRVLAQAVWDEERKKYRQTSSYSY